MTTRAKVFNLKQMAQTMRYLTEHGLLEYAVLEEKATAATARHNELSAQIKAAETHMAEILLHEAVKQAFADLGIKKLPTVKSLQAEYATLLEEKKKDCAEYRHSREELRELWAADKVFLQ